jgi:hypothetical protein
MTDCEPHDVAAWIGLADASLLGTEPIRLPASTVERLKLLGDRVELTTGEVGAILRVSKWRVRNYCLPADEAGRGRPVLGYRRSMPGAPLKVVAADLAAWIVQTRNPPVPTTGAPPRADLARARQAEEEVRRRHNLPRRAA